MEASALFNRQEFSLRNTVFLRLIVTFLLIMLPILFFAVYLYQWIVQTTSADIARTAISQTDFYLTDLGNEIERIKVLQYSLLEDDNLNELTLLWDSMTTIDRTETINSLRARLFTVQNSSKYIKDVSVHIATIERSMSAETSIRDFDQTRYRELRSVFGSRSQVIEWNGGLYLAALKPQGTRDAEPLFTVEIELDRQKLQEALAQFNTYPGSGTVLLYRNGNVRMSSLTPELAGARAALAELPLETLRAGEMERISLNDQQYSAIRAQSDELGISIYRFIPEQVVKEPLAKFYTWAWVFVLTALGIIVAFGLSTYNFIHKPILTLVKSFRRMEQGDLNISIAHASKDEFRYLYERFNLMVGNLRSLIDQVYKQKIMAQRAELKQLQSQINPHFLYNSFFILNTMAKTGDNERIEQFTTLLGEYFQFVTRNASDLVTLEQEMHHATMYAEIQELRFSRRIQVEIEPLPEELCKLTVPRLIVQPILENAFKHSLEKKARDGRIVVSYAQSEQTVSILIEDSGNRLTDEGLLKMEHVLRSADDQAETTGIVNIHRRLAMTYGEASGLRVDRSPLGGLRVEIILGREGGASDAQDADRG